MPKGGAKSIRQGEKSGSCLRLRPKRCADKLAPATRAAYDVLRTAVPPIERDTVMYEQMERCEAIVRSGALISAVEAITGELN